MPPISAGSAAKGITAPTTTTVPPPPFPGAATSYPNGAIVRFGTSDYLVLRMGETGSWLGRGFQGKGIGTAMRQVICAFLIDHVDAQHITSAAFADNPASLAVSRKTGYTDNGSEPFNRMGKPATLRRIALDPASLVRYKHALTVAGLPEFRESIGLG